MKWKRTKDTLSFPFCFFKKAEQMKDKDQQTILIAFLPTCLSALALILAASVLSSKCMSSIKLDLPIWYLN